MRAKESRALRPDRTFPSSFPIKHNLSVSRIFETDEDEKLRTSSDSFITRSASKFNTADCIWGDRQKIRRQAFSYNTHLLILDYR